MSTLWLALNLLVLVICVPIVAAFVGLAELFNLLARGSWWAATNILPKEWRNRLLERVKGKKP